ncbi:MAG TPA: DUF2007 domain-containing protein [Bacteroidales bacterium]|jgi:hypothetical protein|nr:DUF2007 domain-containing protein [Bacteroidales bacterium]HPY80456.1 DUF2007 domain-containing protein [Bacteroidales bacterium]HQA87433.1 DUF2007 domain-containing protein [Bacteroidales bacterium]
MDDKLVTVLFFDNVQQAYILQAELDSFGITSYIADEFMSQMYAFSYAVGGVKVQVREEDFEKAKKLLKELGYEK